MSVDINKELLRRNRSNRKLLESGASGALVELCSNPEMGGTAFELEKRKAKPVKVIVPRWREKDSAYQRTIRLHELIHARFSADSQTKYRKFSQTVRNICEDVRVQGRYWKDCLITEKQARDATCAAYLDMRSTVNESLETQLYNLIRSYAIGFACNSKLQATCSERLYELLGVPDSRKLRIAIKQLANPFDSRNTEVTAMKTIAKYFDVISDLEGELIRDDDKPPLPPPVVENVDTDSDRKIETVRLPMRAFTSPDMIERKTASCVGAKINVKRLISSIVSGQLNSRLYDRRRPKLPGGVILIDASGSMAANSEKLNRLCQLVPQATVAYYSGGDIGMHDGKLVTYAVAGKRADTVPNDTLLGGNGIDDFAIAWLMAQRGPRVYIGDGHFVCPNVDDTHRRFNVLVNAGLIEWVKCNSLAEAIRKLERDNNE
jgi:hypothetical protein